MCTGISRFLGWEENHIEDCILSLKIAHLKGKKDFVIKHNSTMGVNIFILLWIVEPTARNRIQKSQINEDKNISIISDKAHWRTWL